MTVKLASLKADLSREAKGDWVDAPDFPGVAFNVSSLHLPAFSIARDLLFQKLARTYKKAPIPPDVLTKEVGALLNKHILHGWRGLDVEYTPEVAAEIMTDPEYRNVIAAVQNCAALLSELDVEFVEDAEKNSAAPSAGK